MAHQRANFRLRQRCSRLIQQQQAGIGLDRLRDLHDLLVGPGERLDTSGGIDLAGAEPLQDLPRASPLLTPTNKRPGAQLLAEEDVLRDGER